MKPFLLNKIAQPTRDCRSHPCRGDTQLPWSDVRESRPRVPGVRIDVDRDEAPRGIDSEGIM